MSQKVGEQVRYSVDELEDIFLYQEKQKIVQGIIQTKLKLGFTKKEKQMLDEQGKGLSKNSEKWKIHNQELNKCSDALATLLENLEKLEGTLDIVQEIEAFRDKKK